MDLQLHKLAVLMGRKMCTRPPILKCLGKYKTASGEESSALKMGSKSSVEEHVNLYVSHYTASQPREEYSPYSS